MDKTFATKLSSYLNCLYKRDDIENAKIIYALELLLNTQLKLMGVFTIAFLFHLVKDTIIMILLFTLLRIFSGGMHCETSLSCFFAYSSIIIGGAIFSKYIFIPLHVYLPVMAINGYIIHQYAPSETKLIKYSKNTRIKYKLYSLLTLILYVVISLFFNNLIFRTKTFVVVTSIAITILPALNRKYHTD